MVKSLLFQADTICRVKGKQARLLEDIKNVYYIQHPYQYKKEYPHLDLQLVTTGKTDENSSLLNNFFVAQS